MYEEKILEKVKRSTLESSFTKINGKLVRVAASVCNGTKHLGSGINSNKSHPVMEKYNEYFPYDRKCFLHAEIASLINAGWRPGNNNLRGSTIYVARKLNIQGYGNSRPCPACMAAIKDAGIKKVVYTTEDGYAIEHLKDVY